MKSVRTLVDAADMLQAFLGDDPRLGQWDWDDFTSVRHKDPDVERLRHTLNEIDYNNPATVLL